MVYRRRRRATAPRNVIQSFKKVLNQAPASHAAAAVVTTFLSVGTDSVAAGQTSAVDTQVPTGSVIKQIEIQHSAVNLVGIASFMHVSIQRTHAGQSPITPNAIGGSNQRNQVFFQKLYSLGQDQIHNATYKFKVPKKYQRVREGDNWQFTITCDTIWSDAVQVIYKFYR